MTFLFVLPIIWFLVGAFVVSGLSFPRHAYHGLRDPNGFFLRDERGQYYIAAHENDLWEILRHAVLWPLALRGCRKHDPTLDPDEDGYGHWCRWVDYTRRTQKVGK